MTHDIWGRGNLSKISSNSANCFGTDSESESLPESILLMSRKSRHCSSTVTSFNIGRGPGTWKSFRNTLVPAMASAENCTLRTSFCNWGQRKGCKSPCDLKAVMDRVL